MMKKSALIIQIAIFLAIAPVLTGQRPGQEYKPGFIKWIDDNRMLVRLYDDEKQPMVRNEENLIVKEYDCRTGKSVKVEDYRTDTQKIGDLLPEGVTPGPDMAVSSDRTAVVLSRDMDLWYYSSGTTDGIKLTDDQGREVNMRFAPGDRRIAYTKDRDLYYYDLDQKRETRLTFDATDKIYNGWASWVYYEEILGRASRYAAFWWSPDAARIAFLHTDDSPVPLFYLNRLEVSDGPRGELETGSYPKPGDPNPKVKMGIADLATNAVT